MTLSPIIFRCALILMLSSPLLPLERQFSTMNASEKTYAIVVELPCKDGSKTAEVIVRYTNMRLVEVFRILQGKRPYRLPFMYSHDESIRFAQDLHAVGTGSQIIQPGHEGGL